MHDCDAFGFIIAPGDYTSLSQTITLSSATTSVNLMIAIIDDDICEPDEMFEIMLTSMNDKCAITSSPVPVLIIDNDGELPVLLCYMCNTWIHVFYSCKC